MFGQSSISRIMISNKQFKCELIIFLLLGDRLTDERVQAAQKAMNNAETQLQRLQGFVSKIEDFHRLMNFLEVSLMKMHVFLIYNM